MAAKDPHVERSERRVLIGAMFVVCSLLIAAVAVQVNRGPLGPRPVPDLPLIIRLQGTQAPAAVQDPVRWPGLPPVPNVDDDETAVTLLGVDEPGQILEIDVVELASLVGGAVVAVGSDDGGVHVFPSLSLSGGGWLPSYRIITPWDLDGTVDVPVVVEVEGQESTHILRLGFDAPEPEPAQYDVVVTPEMMERLPELVDRAPQGPTRFLLPPGEYRELSIHPKDGQSFVGAVGSEPTVLNGSRVIDGWARADDGTWTAGGQNHVGWGFLDRDDRVRSNPSDDEWGTCEREAGDVCKFPELLFFDDKPLRRVADRDEVAAGEWYFDYAADEIVVADDPRGHVVEFAAVPQAFTSLADDVRIENLVVEKYASPMRQGAIQPRLSRLEPDPGRNWVISDVEVAWNHGYGIKADIGMIIEHSWIHDNFQMGVGAGSSEDVVLRRSEISGNCAGDSNMGAMCDGNSGGGVKLDFSDRATLRENFVHGNFPHGLHVDQFSNDAVFVGNVTVDNTNAGLHFEISSGALIEGNYASGNGEAGILVISSSDVSVSGNHVTGNEDAILVRQDERCRQGQPECIRGLRVAANYVDLGVGTTGLSWSSSRAPSPFTRFADNRFEANVYVIAQGNCRAEPFRWGRSKLDWSDWSAEGQDEGGHIIWPECIVAGSPWPVVGALPTFYEAESAGSL